MINHPEKSRNSLIRSVFCILIAVTTPGAKPAMATGFCERMNALVVQARSNFSDATAQSTGAVTSRPLAGSEKCTMSRSETGANAYHCIWGFPYRDAAASAFFGAVDEDLRGCFADSAEVANDQGVNHPDTYDQRRYGLDDVVVTVSLKDKSALRRTYVFLGVFGSVPE